MKQYRYENGLSRKNRVSRALWGVAYTIFFRPTPRWIFDGWRAFLLRRFGATIGTGCRINPTARIWAPWNLTLGDFVAIAEGVDLYSVARISIGSKTTISQRAFICTASHDITDLKRPLIYAPVILGQHVWVAAEAMIHPGVSVSDGAVVAARSVLRKDPEPWTIWAGNPAKLVGERQVSDNAPAKNGNGIKDG